LHHHLTAKFEQRPRPPGASTAQVSSVSGTAGITLVEIYAVP